MNWRYIAWSVLIVFIGTFIWSVAYGLAYDLIIGIDPLQKAGLGDITAFDLVLYILYGVLFGGVVSWRAPEKGWLHSICVAVLYVLLFFRFGIFQYAAYALVCLAFATLAGLSVSGIRTAMASRTGK